MNGSAQTVNLLKPYSRYEYSAVTNPNSTTSWWPISYIAAKYVDHILIDGTANMNHDTRNILISVFCSGW